MFIADGGIVSALPRIGWRQFEWQQGHFFSRKVYRAWRLYTIGSAGLYFSEKYGVETNIAISLVLRIFGAFLLGPRITVSDISELSGHDFNEVKTVLEIISKNIDELVVEVTALRKKHAEIAYKPSVLRTFPITSIEGRFEKEYYCPIPDLCIQRLTDGLFQDLVGKQSVMNDVALEFEKYSRDILNHYSDGFYEVKVEEEYGPSARRVKTPDLRLVTNTGEVEVIIECKRRILSYRVASSVDPVSEFPQDYNDLIKGIQQIWRCVSNLRRGSAGEHVSLGEKCVGLVLTLHPWTQMSGEAVLWLKEQAKMQLRAEWNVLDCDMIPVSFTHSDDLEAVLQQLPINRLQTALERHAQDDRLGYSFRHVAQEFYSDHGEIEAFDYNGKLPEFVPWWGEIERALS